MQSKNLGRHPSTEKALKASENISKGAALERLFSQNIHKNNYPVLVSSRLLRDHGLGQIDLCLYKNKELFLFEIKSSPSKISKKQINRLNRSLAFLIHLFNAQGYLKVLKNLPKD